MNSINSNFDLPNQPEYFKNFLGLRQRQRGQRRLSGGRKKAVWQLCAPHELCHQV